jgi:hypothetical protein
MIETLMVLKKISKKTLKIKIQLFTYFLNLINKTMETINANK